MSSQKLAQLLGRNLVADSKSVFLKLMWIETVFNCVFRLEGYVDQCYKEHLKNKGKVDLVSKHNEQMNRYKHHDHHKLCPSVNVFLNENRNELVINRCMELYYLSLCKDFYSM